MRSLFNLILYVLPLFGKAQSPNSLGPPLVEIAVDNLDLISFDTKDQLFASNISGDIYLFSQEGKQLNLFSPARQGRLAQLEAGWTVNIFSFSEDLQEYRNLDRFLNPLVWVWDESDLNLKSLDYLRNQIIQSQPLNLIVNSSDLNVSEIREFKNRLFMNVPDTAIYIFDNQGNLMRKLEVTDVNKLCYYNEHLLWIADDKLMAISLSTNETLTLAQLDSPGGIYLQIGQERLAVISKNKISLYPTPDWIKSLK